MGGRATRATGPSEPMITLKKIAGFSCAAHRMYRNGVDQNCGADIVDSELGGPMADDPRRGSTGILFLDKGRISSRLELWKGNNKDEWDSRRRLG